MCGRYTQTAAFDELALRFGITVEEVPDEDLTSRYNVAPSQPVPIVVADEGGRRLVMARWGFHPGWMKSSKLAPINAKAETVATSGMFQAAVERGRCLVPASGFYEWKPLPGWKPIPSPRWSPRPTTRERSSSSPSRCRVTATSP